MLNAHERHLLTFYLANAASAFHHVDREASSLVKWVADRENLVAHGRWSRRFGSNGMKPDLQEAMSAEQWRRLAETLRDESAATKQARPDRIARRLQSLAATADLSRTDLGILELLLRYQTRPIIESMVDDVFGPAGRRFQKTINLNHPSLSVLLGVSVGTIHCRLRSDAPLVRSGIVSIDREGDLMLLGRLHRLATSPRRLERRRHSGAARHCVPERDRVVGLRPRGR